METVSTDWGEFHATVLPAMEGKLFEIEDLNGDGFHRWGAALGRFHRALMGYPGRNARSTWEDHLDVARGHLPPDSPALHAELDEIASLLSELPVTSDNYGLSHADFELDNLVWRDDSAAVLDFDDCSWMWFAADVAFALGDLFEEHPNLADERFVGFVDGYATCHPLDNESLSNLPLFVRLDNILQHARMVRTVDLRLEPEHPDWLHELHQKLHQRIALYRSSVNA